MGGPTLYTYKGGRFTGDVAASLHELDRLTPTIPVRIMQGGWNAGGVRASAGTHDCDAVDIAAVDLTGAQRAEVVRVLRAIGWAAWLRRPDQGFPWHIHAVPAGWGVVSAGAALQVQAYRQGYNGLASWGRDDGPRTWVGRTWHEYLASLHGQTQAAEEQRLKETAARAAAQQEEGTMKIVQDVGGPDRYIVWPDGLTAKLQAPAEEASLRAVMSAADGQGLYLQQILLPGILRRRAEGQTPSPGDQQILDSLNALPREIANEIANEIEARQ